MQHAPFGTLTSQLVFEVVLNRNKLGNILADLHADPNLDCYFPPTDWGRYKVLSFKTNVETNADLDKDGVAEPIELALRAKQFVAFAGAPQ